MIYTSYYGNWRNFPEDYKLVSTSVHNPDGHKYLKAKPLRPPYDLWKAYKYENLSWEDYTTWYTREVLDKLSPDKIAKKLDGSILLCFCHAKSNCHRHLLREWMIKHGINVQELKYKGMKNEEISQEN